MSDIDPIVKAAVDAWLGEVENFGLRAERVPEGAIPWLYEAAMVGAIAVVEENTTAALERAIAGIGTIPPVEGWPPKD